MPQDALSQEAIDQLLREMVSGTGGPAEEAISSAALAASGKPRDPATPRRIREYDFRRPNRISKEYMRGLRLIHENFAREAPRVWGPLLRAGGQIKILSMEQTIYDEFRNHLSPNCFVCTAVMAPLEGEIAFQMESEAAFIFLDRLLGGPGTGMVHTREMTALELNVLQRIITAILPTWREAWLPIIHLEPSVIRTLGSMEFLQLTAANESVLVTTFQARFLETNIELTVCIPYTVLAPILSRVVVSEHLTGQGGFDATERERLIRQMHRVPLAVAARLGTTAIPISELAQLMVGDVIRLDVPTDGGEAHLHISDHPYFTARPGTLNGNLAVQVTGVCPHRD